MNSQTLNESLNLAQFAIPGGNYGYTGAQVDALQSFENTIAVGLLDESGSTGSFARQMEICVKEIIKALRHSPAADKLIYRHCHFATNFREFHGYTPLANLNEDMYDGCYVPGGQTALYDSCDRIFAEMLDYAQRQVKMKYTCNGIAYIMTDGRDLGSTRKQADVRDRLASVIASEALESMMTILIGVNDDPSIQQDLESFQKFVGFTQYVPLKDADAKTLAKLSAFISKSVVAQSQALGTGGPSQSLIF